MPDITSAFLETTDVYDVDVIKGLDVNSQEFKEFLVRLRQNINNIALSVNGRDGGYYPLGEFNTGTQLFPLDPTVDPQVSYRTITRDVVNFGVMPNAGTLSVNHTINTPTGTNANYVFTRIYGAATNSGGLAYLPLPYTDPTGNIASISVSQTQVTIQTNFNASAYTAIIVLEYIVN